MGRDTGPTRKVSRGFGEAVFGRDQVLEKRTNPPGQHGPNKRRGKKMSEYGIQLREKQKAKAIYGMREKQFRLFFDRSKAKEGVTGDVMLAMCECRLDNIVYRLGLAPSRAGARQPGTRRHVTLTGEVCNVPSAIVRPGDVVSMREKDRGMIAVIDSLERQKTALVDWLSWDAPTMQGTLLSVPERSQIPENLEMQLIVEFFSR